MGVFKRTIKRNGKKKEYWYIDYCVNGKRKWESVGRVGEVTKAFAKKILTIRKTEIVEGKYYSSKMKYVPTFSEYCAEYLEFAKGNKKSWDRDECALRVLKPFFGTYRLDNITPILIEKYKLMRQETVSLRTINIELSILRRMFNVAINWDKCETNPIAKVKFYKEEPLKERILSAEEENRLFHSSPQHLIPILVTALNTGMRYAEIIGLKWKHIDFDSDYINIETSKSGKSRNIPINSLLKSTLLKLKTEYFVSNTVSTNYSAQQKNEQLHDTYLSRRDGLKSRWAYAREGSTPSLPTLQIVSLSSLSFRIGVLARISPGLAWHEGRVTAPSASHPLRAP